MEVNLKKDEMNLLKDIVNYRFGVDIMQKTRKRRVVQARMAYTKILRNKGYSFEEIGSSLKKNHASIYNYIKKMMEWDLKYDAQFKEKYEECCVDFYHEHDPVYDMGIKDLLIEIFALRQKIKELTLTDKESIIFPQDDERFKKIFTLIREKTPFGKESELEEKVSDILTSMI